MFRYIPSTGEYWSEETQKSYAALISLQYHDGSMTLHQLEDELAENYISREDFDNILKGVPMTDTTIQMWRVTDAGKVWRAWHTTVYSREESIKTIELCKGTPDACKVEIHYHAENTDVIFEKIQDVWIEKEQEGANNHE